MIVNVYENQSLILLNHTLPDLASQSGFNYVHYAYQNYFILLPDLEYEIGNVREKMISSLRAAVNKSFDFGSIDLTKLAIVGMSYGGYEAGLALSGTNLFRTGIMGVMVSDFVSFSLSESKAMRLANYKRVENYQNRMGQSLFENWSNYVKESPIFHIQSITSPILIWCGLKDPNVPPTQSKEMFLGLKRLSKKAILLEYPNEEHQIMDLKAREDLNVRQWQWLEYYLKGKSPADWLKQLQ